MRAIYLYGFAPAATPLSGGRRTRPRSRRAALRFLACGPVTAAVTDVPAEEFCGATGERNLQDLAWLAPRVCAHQAVLDELMQAGPLWPAGFATLFSSRRALDGFVHQHRAAIADFLARVWDHAEWTVQVTLDPARAEAALVDRSRREEESRAVPGPGRSYLNEKHRRRQAGRELDDHLAAALIHARDRLAPLAAAVASRRIPAADAGPASRVRVAHWAFLLRRDAVRKFRDAIKRANLRPELAGLAFELSGPWPPSSFCPRLERV